jgi:ribonuclease R
LSFNDALHELRGERTGIRYRLADRVTVQIARVDLEARRIDFRLVRGTDRKSLQQMAAAAEPGARKPREPRKGESVEERRARQAAASARKLRDVDKRERARTGKRGVGGLRHAKSRHRGR